MSEKVLLAGDYTALPFIRRFLDEFSDAVDVPSDATPDRQITVVTADVQELDHTYGPILQLSSEESKIPFRFRVPRDKVLGIIYDAEQLKRSPGFA